MKVKVSISPEIKDKVSSQLLEFVKRVMEGESLNHWPVHIWLCKGEGLCDEIIRFGLCETERKTQLLFLHEVAHALRNHIDWDDSYWHRDCWGNEFDRLCRKYLGVAIDDCSTLRSLFVKGVGDETA